MWSVDAAATATALSRFLLGLIAFASSFAADATGPATATAGVLHAAVTPIVVSEYAVGAPAAGEDGGGDHQHGLLHLVGTSNVVVLCVSFDRQLFGLMVAGANEEARNHTRSHWGQGFTGARALPDLRGETHSRVVPLLALAHPAASLTGVQLRCRRGSDGGGGSTGGGSGGGDGADDGHLNAPQGQGSPQLVFELCDGAVRGGEGGGDGGGGGGGDAGPAGPAPGALGRRRPRRRPRQQHLA